MQEATLTKHSVSGGKFPMEHDTTSCDSEEKKNMITYFCLFLFYCFSILAVLILSFYRFIVVLSFYRFIVSYCFIY
jgi:nitrate reductase NapE component